MCGFVGSLSRRGRVTSESIVRATASLAHRGPDDSGTACLSGSEYELKLGFRRLAILDLSAAGHQPMADPESGNWIVFNGEIYNFRAIRDELQSEGISCTTQCDTEVLLKAYRCWGIDCLHRLRGMFAFALWDCAQQRLLLARDRLGKKPLYYYRAGNLLLFASEIRGLLATGLVEKRVNPAALVQYLGFGSVYDPETIIPGVRSLRPGYFAICEQGTITEKRYWTIPQSPCSSSPPKDAEIEEQLHFLLREATTLRMISDVPVSIFLSGGVDSSALVALVRESTAADFHTFSVVFPEAADSEAPYSQAVARQFGSSHQEVMVSESDALGYVSSALRCMDQPTIDGVNTFIISSAVRSHGFKVALSGIGADEIFAGYSTFATIPKMLCLLKLVDCVPASIRDALSRGLGPAWNRGDRRRKLQMILGAEGTPFHAYLMVRGLFAALRRDSLLRVTEPEVVCQAFQSVRKSAEDSATLDAVNQVSFLELRNYLGNTLVRDADTMGMAHGLEIRQPYLDHKLIEFLFTVSGAYKRKRKSPKWLLTRSLGTKLPPQVVHRAKRGFALPFDRWLRSELRSEVESVLRARDRTSDFLDPVVVNTIWEDFLAGRTSWSRPWALYVLKRWTNTLYA
jgi:asparagine synthase (glutamine-hydrolysing)